MPSGPGDSTSSAGEAGAPPGKFGLPRPVWLLGLTSLFTASAVGLRDHFRDVGVLRAMGLTPGQVVAALVMSTGVLAVLATVTGAGLGLALSTRLINLGGQAYGIGAGIGSPPSLPAVLAAAVAAVAVTTLAAVIPAWRAVRLPVAAMIGPAG